MIGKRAACAALIFGCFAAVPGQSLAVSILELVSTPGLTITAHDKLFSDWTAIGTVTGAGNIDLAQLDVTPIVDDPLNPGLKFTAPLGALGTAFGHAGPASVDLDITFRVRTISGLPLIKDNSLLINGYNIDSGPNAFIQISEDVLDSSGNLLGQKLAIVQPSDAPNDPDHFDAAEFPPQSLIQVVKRIRISGPGTNDGAFLMMFEQRFSQVPEPTCLLLSAVLCLPLVMVRPWRRHASLN